MEVSWPGKYHNLFEEMKLGLVHRYAGFSLQPFSLLAGIDPSMESSSPSFLIHCHPLFNSITLIILNHLLLWSCWYSPPLPLPLLILYSLLYPQLFSILAQTTSNAVPLTTFLSTLHPPFCNLSLVDLDKYYMLKLVFSNKTASFIRIYDFFLFPNQ